MLMDIKREDLGLWPWQVCRSGNSNILPKVGKTHGPRTGPWSNVGRCGLLIAAVSISTQY